MHPSRQAQEFNEFANFPGAFTFICLVHSLKDTILVSFFPVFSYHLTLTYDVYISAHYRMARFPQNHNLILHIRSVRFSYHHPHQAYGIHKADHQRHTQPENAGLMIEPCHCDYG